MGGSVRRQAVFLGVLLLLSLALGACSGSATTSSAEQGEPQDSLTRVDGGQGGVTVQAIWVTPLHLREMAQDVFGGYPAERYVLIHLKLDTHSVDLLKYDLPSLVTLQGRNNTYLVPEAWLALEESDHHREGIVAFPMTSNEQWAAIEGVASLTLREIAGVSERVFTWEFPSAGE
ncbi:MAG: hypothetical protein HYU29_06370 [Chloroflexi bacterium]|nr:hypothetical protein [Chloroflexota bacterium]